MFSCSICEESNGTKHFKIKDAKIASICDRCWDGALVQNHKTDGCYKMSGEIIRWLASHPGATRITEDEAIIMAVMRE
jgi:hypothetical protein